VACRTPRPQLFGDLEGAKDLQFFRVTADRGAQLFHRLRQLVQADRPLRQNAAAQQFSAERIAIEAPRAKGKLCCLLRIG
jgi:hypothetical protein